MNEGALRWKGRLGSLKALAALVLLFAVIFLIGAISNYTLASSNPTQPQTVQIGQLAGNEIGLDRYVTFSGLALYPAAYEETEDNKTTGEFFYVVNTDTGEMVLVKSAKSLPITESEEEVTISGLTHVPEPKLRTLSSRARSTVGATNGPYASATTTLARSRGRPSSLSIRPLRKHSS